MRRGTSRNGEEAKGGVGGDMAVCNRLKHASQEFFKSDW